MVEVCELELVNSKLNITGVNSLRLEGFHIHYRKNVKIPDFKDTEINYF